MKKLIFKMILLIIFTAFLVGHITSIKAFAYEVCNYQNRCPANPQGDGSSIEQFFSDVTGSTFLVEKFAQNMIKSELKKITNQDFEVKVKAFSVADLIEGKFKSLSISGNNVVIAGMHLSHLNVNTLCGYNSVDIKSRPIRLREDAVLSILAEFSASDLRNSIEYQNYSQIVSTLDLSSLGIASFKVYSPTICVENNKLYFTINAKPVGQYKPLDISVGADIKVENGNVISSKIDFINLYSGFSLTQLSSYLNPINYLKFHVNLSKTQRAEVQIQDVNIIGDKVYLKAVMFIPRN